MGDNMQERFGEIYNRIKKVSYSHVVGAILFLYTLAPLWFVHVEQEHLLFAVAIQGILFGFAWRMKDITVLKPDGLFEFTCYGIGGLGLIGILLYCLGMDIGYQEGYNTELCMLLFALIYLTIKCRPVYEKWYADAILAGLIMLQIICLICYLVYPEMKGSLAAFVMSKGCVAISAMVALLIAGMRYAYAGNKVKQLMYVTAVAVSAIVLAVNRDVLSLYLTAILLLVVVAYGEPKKEVIKRNLQVFGGYLFLLCNMSLITGYTKWIQIECVGYSLESSVTAELFLCAFLCYVMHVWDKLPKKDKDARVKMIRKLQKVMRLLLVLFSVALAGVYVTGKALEQLPGGMIGKVVQTEGIVFWQTVQSVATDNLVYASIKSFGVAGLGIVLLFATAVWGRLRTRFRPVIPERNLLKTLAIALIVWWSIHTSGMTIYGIGMWVLSYAVVPGLKFKGKKKIDVSGDRKENEADMEKQAE